jgi:16S rRNA (cytidine1402-2'-O)-methyltransferase
MAQGTLYLVATPIGNLEDITLRALRILKEVDLVACEDTRHSLKLLSHAGISTPRESFHEHNEAARTPRFLGFLQQGRSIALVTDAGMPLISDPGFTLVRECIRAGIRVVPIPGPSAVLAALAGSGLPADDFYFAGFLPPTSSRRRRRLEEISTLPCTLVFYEAPHRLLVSLKDMVEILGPRNGCMARELTKIHEEFLHGTLSEILETLQSRQSIQGEITLIVGGGDSRSHSPDFPDSIREHVEKEMSTTGASRKEALRGVARQRGISRREAYRQLLDEKDACADE